MTTLIKSNGCCTPAATRNPFRDLEQHLSRVFSAAPSDPEWNVGAWLPAIDIHEDDDKYTIVADLPGIQKEDLTLTVKDNVFTLKGERKKQTEANGKGYHRVERAYGTFQRAFQIPGGVDATKVEAKFEHGVLQVSLPKPEASKPHSIEIKVN